MATFYHTAEGPIVNVDQIAYAVVSGTTIQLWMSNGEKLNLSLSSLDQRLASALGLAKTGFLQG